MAADSTFQLQKTEPPGNQLKAFAAGQSDRFGLEGFAQALRHGLGIAKVRTGCCSALVNETPSGACAAHSFGLGKAGLKRLDTFTILKADASSGWYPPDENYAPANLSIAQGSLF